MPTVYCAEIVASFGLVLDVVGIYLLYKNGAVGGEWIKVAAPKSIRLESEPGSWPVQELAAEAETDRNFSLARRGSRIGLSLATTGFFLQGVAQWLPVIAQWL